MKNVENKKQKYSFFISLNFANYDAKTCKNPVLLQASLYQAEQSEKLIISYHYQGFCMFGTIVTIFHLQEKKNQGGE